MRTPTLNLTIVLAVLIAAVPVLAHHSDVAYEKTAIELKTATIVKVSWINPHAVVACDVKDDSGKVSHWTLEMGSPSAMSRVGWDRNSLLPGELEGLVHEKADRRAHPRGCLRPQGSLLTRSPDARPRAGSPTGRACRAACPRP